MLIGVNTFSAAEINTVNKGLAPLILMKLDVFHASQQLVGSYAAVTKSTEVISFKTIFHIGWIVVTLYAVSHGVTRITWWPGIFFLIVQIIKFKWKGFGMETPALYHYLKMKEKWRTPVIILAANITLLIFVLKG